MLVIDSYRCMRRSQTGGPPPPPPGGDTLATYPGLDLNTIPWHTASGAWGNQYVMPKADPPVTTSEASPTTAAEFQANLVSGRRLIIGPGVTITFGVSELQAQGVTLTDVDIVIHPTASLRYFALGSYNSGDVCVYNRIRVRGPTLGSYSGGQLHQFKVVIDANASNSCNNLIVDGLGCTASASDDITATTAIGLQTGTTSSRRFNMTNCRVASGGEGYIGDMGDTIFAGNSWLTALTNPEPIEDESWAIRIMGLISGSHIVFENDMRAAEPGRTNVFHRVRVHPDANGVGHFFMKGCTLVDRVESRAMWCDADAGSQNGWLESFMTENNTYYMEGLGLSFYSESAIYNRFRNETFYSALSLSDSSLTVRSSIAGPPEPGIPTVKVVDNNTYNGTATPPAWGAAGDPSGLNWNI